jgi:hypothetical protein
MNLRMKRILSFTLRIIGGKGLAFLALLTGLAFAQSPPFVITGPQVSLRPGCTLGPLESPPPALTTTCVSIAYAPDSSISQNRYVLVLEFDSPVSSAVAKLIKGGVTAQFTVTVNVAGPNPGEFISQASLEAMFHDKGDATLRIPVNVDWAESIVSFQIEVAETVCLPGFDSHGDPNCKHGQGTFPGPDLSAITSSGNWIGSQWPTPLTNDAFLVVATPAASFQLPIIPTTIVYGPLGNGPNAASTYSVTEVTATNQQFSNSHDQTLGVTSDDKTELQGGMTISLSPPKAGENDDRVVCGQDTGCKLSLGFTYAGAWDQSTETDNQNSYGTSKSVSFETQKQFTITVVPTPGQPPLDQITPDAQPFWADVILGVANAQYALWDYPAGPVIQPLGGASLVTLPIRQLDRCANAPGAIEPAAFSPGQWAPSSTFNQGTAILDSNHNIQVLTSSGGVTGTTAPIWNTTDGGVTTDGSITWTNEQSQFGIYRGSVVQDNVQYLRLGPWEPNQFYPAGSVVRGPASIEVATIGGISGASVPNWNKADESTTTDGTVIWTNEQDHLVVSAGPVASHQSALQWLTADNCKAYLSLDQFYVNKAQSATPIAYDVLGSMLSLVPNDVYTYSNQNKTASTFGDSNTSKLTTQVTSVASHSLSVSGAINFGLNLAGSVLGIDLSGSDTHNWSTTTSNTTVDSQTLESAQTVTGQVMSSTTIQDLGSEQSIPVNILQDSIFLGIAVQDTNLHSTPHTQAATTVSYREALPQQFRSLPIVPVGHSSASIEGNGSSEPTDYVQQTNYGFAVIVSKPHDTPEVEEQVHAHQTVDAGSHEQRVIPAPPPPSTQY